MMVEGPESTVLLPATASVPVTTVARMTHVDVEAIFTDGRLFSVHGVFLTTSPFGTIRHLPGGSNTAQS